METKALAELPQQGAKATNRDFAPICGHFQRLARASMATRFASANGHAGPLSRGRLVLGGIMAASVFWGCSSQPHPASPMGTSASPATPASAIAPAPQQAATGPTAPAPLSVIGHLEFRNQTVTIYASPQGPRYSIRSKQGILIAREISDAELAAKYRDLYQAVKTGLAGNDARLHWSGK
jgi:hypothetical protein